MFRIPYVAAEDENASGLNLSCAREDAQQRGFSDAVGPDEADHAAGGNLDRDIFERGHAAVSLGEASDPRD